VAVEMVRDKGVDFYCFITMDKEMPVMDGYKSTRAIRQLGFRRTILGVTGNALLSDIQAFRASGVTSVLTKPVDAPVLRTWAEASRWWQLPQGVMDSEQNSIGGSDAPCTGKSESETSSTSKPDAKCA
jgi:CheY-like chemotaxis protein